MVQETAGGSLKLKKVITSKGRVPKLKLVYTLISRDNDAHACFPTSTSNIKFNLKVLGLNLKYITFLNKILRDKT